MIFRRAHLGFGFALVALTWMGFTIAVASEVFAATSPARVSPEPASATITFKKVFKTSYPEYVEIKLTDSGAGTFDIRQLDEAASVQPFDIGQPIVQKVFELAGKLHDFQGIDLEVHHRLANLGEKTLRYEKGAENHEITFNYTLDPVATQLLAIFEGITRQETDLSDLQRAMHYDRLGVNDVIVQVETDFNDKLLPEPQRLLPVLDQVAADSKYIEIARQRARTLAGKIRAAQ